MVWLPLRKMFPLAFWAGKSIAIGKSSPVVFQLFWLAGGLNLENAGIGQCRKQVGLVCPLCISSLTLERKRGRNWCWTHPGWSPVCGLECIMAKLIYFVVLADVKNKTKQRDWDPPQSAWEFHSKIVVFQTNVLTPAREGDDQASRWWAGSVLASFFLLRPVCTASTALRRALCGKPARGVSFLPGTLGGIFLLGQCPFLLVEDADNFVQRCVFCCHF